MRTRSRCRSSASAGEELVGWKEEGREAHGKFLLRRLANPDPAKVIYDFVDHARPPHADVRGTNPPLSCTWNTRATVAAGGLGGHPTFPARALRVPRGVFFNVGVTVIADEEFRPRRCLWSHPFARGEIVTRFHDVPLGRGHPGSLRALLDHGAREARSAHHAHRARGRRHRGQHGAQATATAGRASRSRSGAHAGAEKAEVEFAVSTSFYRDRHFCFEADTR
jgi:hypothetical protein